MASLAKPIENFEKIKKECLKSCKSREETFDDFVDAMKWKQYKQKMTKQIIQHKKRNGDARGEKKSLAVECSKDAKII